MKHYYIEDRSNKKKALTLKGFPSYANDRIQFNLYGDESIVVNIQSYDLNSNPKKNITKDLSVLINLEDLKLAYAHKKIIGDSMNEVLFAPDPFVAKNTSGGRILLGIATFLNSLAALQSPRSNEVGNVVQETRNQLNV